MKQNFYKILCITLLSVLIYSCNNNVTEPQTGSSVLFEKQGLYDSVKKLSGTINLSYGPDTSLSFLGYSKLRFTFDYKAYCDSMEFYYFRWYTYSSITVLNFKKKNLNTYGNYISFDTTVSNISDAIGQFGHNLYVNYDSCEAVIRNFRITGIR